MINGIDISSEIMQERYEKNQLGELVTNITGFSKKYQNNQMNVCSNLQELWKYCANLYNLDVEFSHVDKSKITPDNIHSVIIYGSILYKNFPVVHMKTSRKFLFFGDESVKKITKPRESPNDLDLMIITHNPVGDASGFSCEDNIAVKEFNELDEYFGSYYKVTKGLKLHVIYRSFEQFCSNFRKGGKLSEAVINYGIPLVGEKQFRYGFQQLIGTRKELHKIEWREDNHRKLQARIVDSETREIASAKSEQTTSESKPEEEKDESVYVVRIRE